MDPFMQNYLLAGASNIPLSIASLTGQSPNESNNNTQGNENGISALDYQTLMHSYILQQQQQQQHNQAAATQMAAAYINPSLAYLGGDTLSGYGGLTSVTGTNLLTQGLANLEQRNSNDASLDYVDANKLLLKTLQRGQGGLPQQQQQLQLQQELSTLSSDTTNRNGDNVDGHENNGILGPWSATSAGLLGKMATHTLDKGKRARKKPKDKPKRPLSAYNIFFREERNRILDNIPKNEDEIKKEDGEETEADVKSLKRKKRPHGKIGFENLAKMIGQRWQNLEPDKIVYYKKKAEEDMQRYKNQMEEYLAKQNEAKIKMEKMIDDDFDVITSPSIKRIRFE